MLRLVALLVGLAALAACAHANADPVGAWGGRHVGMTISADATAFEFDCATGRIDGPFVVGADGRFDLAGKFAREFGGPARIGESETAVAARYSGRIRGKSMALSVEIDGPGKATSAYELEKGRMPVLLKCL